MKYLSIFTVMELFCLVGLGMARPASAQDAVNREPPSQPLPQPPPPLVARADFAGPEAAVGKQLSRAVADSLAAGGKLTLIPEADWRKAIDAVTKGLDPVDEVNALAAAQRLGAANLVLIAGHYGMEGDQLTLTGHLWVLKEGQVVGVAQEFYRGLRGEQEKATRFLANRFHRRLTGTALPNVEDRVLVEKGGSKNLRPEAAGYGLEISLDRGPLGTYTLRDPVVMEVRTQVSGYLTLLSLDSRGQARLLFPNSWTPLAEDGGPDNWIDAGRSYVFPPSEDSRWYLRITEDSQPGAVEAVIAFVSDIRLLYRGVGEASPPAPPPSENPVDLLLCRGVGGSPPPDPLPSKGPIPREYLRFGSCWGAAEAALRGIEARLRESPSGSSTAAVAFYRIAR
jgi:hypothetical protein